MLLVLPSTPLVSLLISLLFRALAYITPITSSIKPHRLAITATSFTISADLSSLPGDQLLPRPPRLFLWPVSRRLETLSLPPSSPECGAPSAHECLLRVTLLDPCYIPLGLSKVCIVSLSS